MVNVIQSSAYVGSGAGTHVFMGVRKDIDELENLGEHPQEDDLSTHRVRVERNLSEVLRQHRDHPSYATLSELLAELVMAEDKDVIDISRSITDAIKKINI